MALDRRGEFTLLAGRRALALIRLDSPSEVVKRVSRTQQKYDVTAAEWNPTQSQGHTFVLAFGERAEICQWNEGSLNGISSLRAHTRTITDLNWHRLDPNLLATCSIDTFVHIWDTREPRKPVASLSSIAGASQVKWNKLNHNLLASGHDCDVRVWDNRKPTQPTQFISAHLSKIQGLDWSPNHESHLVTSSNDCTVKFFDILNPRKAENFINTLSPVWRARYTPFGEGVVTVVAPQLRRGENPLLLWAVRDVTAPVHTFVGHSDMVLEFEWRLSGGAGAVASGPGEHQLVTWARDHSLRIWRVDQHLQRLCGEEAGLGESTDSEFNSESATLVEGEAGRESGLMREEQDTHSLSGGNEDDAESNSPRYEGGAQPPEASENAVHRASLESSSTTEASEVTVAPASVEKTAGENVSSVSSVAGTPSLPGLAIAKPLPSQASTLPSGQPMSLQQEFSLLNTSLDSSQVNSVEVVTTGREGQPGVGDQQKIITIKEEVTDEEEITLEVEGIGIYPEEINIKEEVLSDEEVVVSSLEDAFRVGKIIPEKGGDTVKVPVQRGGAPRKECVPPTKDTSHRATKKGAMVMKVGTIYEGNSREKVITIDEDTKHKGTVFQAPSQEKKITVPKGDTMKEANRQLKGASGGDSVEKGAIVQVGDTVQKVSTVKKATVREGKTAKEATTQEKVTAEKKSGLEGATMQKEVLSAPEKARVKEDSVQEKERPGVEEGDTEMHIVEDGDNVHEEDSEPKRHAAGEKDSEKERQTMEEKETEKERDTAEERETGQEIHIVDKRDTAEERKSKPKIHAEKEKEAEQKRDAVGEKDSEQGRHIAEERGTKQRRDSVEGAAQQERDTKEDRTSEQERQPSQDDDVPQGEWHVQHGDIVQEKNEITSDSGEGSCSGKKRKALVDGSVGQMHPPAVKRKSSVAAASAVGNGNGDEGGGRKAPRSMPKMQPLASPGLQENKEIRVQDPSRSVFDEPDSTCIIKIQCVGEDREGEKITVVEASDSSPGTTLSFPQRKVFRSPQDKDTSMSSLDPEEDDFMRGEAVIHVECDPEPEMLDIEPKERDDGVAVCQVVTSGSFVIKGAASSLMQVEASVVHLPESLTSNNQNPEEVWGTLAPQLLEGGVIVHGENLVLGVLSLVTMVEAVEVDGEAQTQITISPLAEPVEAYHKRGVNFILVTKNSEAIRGSGGSPEAHSKEKNQVRNAPNSDSPGQFQCDKCDKTYSVRSSLNSHRVTHNAEKLYKCDECDRAFHYSTPLMIHKRTHSDERPYCCQTCHASFKSMTNLRCHQRQHSGERPISCPECKRSFRDYTSLKRHRQRMHQTETSDSSNTAPSVTSPHKSGKDEESEDGQNTDSKSPDAQDSKDRSSSGPGSVGRLSDYIHKCGLCHMTCHTRPQMLTHLQVHAAAERFRCRYCPSAYTFRFLLARHVREMHPGSPQWFCQHCDRIFDTCRKMNSHSCRSVRGNYSCPHQCGFTTEVRHRVFRHVARYHPEDASPYHCDFCSNSYRDPGRLRYHQKRQHPEKMPELAPPPKDTWRASSEAGPEDKGAVDMSQVEVSVVGEAIEYYLPEDLRNDMAFKERVKFKCFYCEAKFPVKNAMTRHVLRAHPGQRAYKCLRCNVFFRSNTESKNHNRKYHKYQDTGGRDPHRNEKAMRKRAELVEQQLRQAAPGLRSAFKFRCLYCPMAYRCKRPLVAHYRRWHPDQEWDHLPDRPPSTPPSSSSKRRRLLFFDCKFNSECGRTFDEIDLLFEHLLHAHEVSGEAALPYVKERVVVEGVRRGRLPKNAVLVPSESPTSGGSQKRRMWWRGRARVKSEPEDTEEEDEFDEAEFELSEGEDEDEEMEGEIIKIKKEHSSSRSQTPEEGQESMPIAKKSINLESIDSVGDVKKMLYRCRRCGVSCSSKVQYRQHTAGHMLSEKEEEDQESKDFSSPEKVPVLGASKKKATELDKSEAENLDEGILVTSLKEEVNDEEEDVKVLTLTPSASGMPMVKVEASAIQGNKGKNSKKRKETELVSQLSTPPSSPPPSSSSSPSSSQTSALQSPSRGASKTQGKVQVVQKKGRHPGVKRKAVAGQQKSSSGQPETPKLKGVAERRGGTKQQGPIRKSRMVASKKLQCPDCTMSFKTRSEMSFHRRLDH
ncbi:uncharacterized protein LOC126981405 isoform X2 [Eriocheir sinensis]|nr:uncharacterized protein LOC126981405 isoform X2 [Eriocheir sinensis]